ncbi:MAG: hypothetical protein GX087_10910 [Desulfobulbaceae bacterium]|nr:hypothetical protein [Desulfobulbaceae bacterium]
MHKGLFVGQCSVEIVYYLPSALQPGQRVKAERQLAFAGGAATNASIAFTAYENVSTLVTGLGEHPLSEAARSDIMEHAVELIDLDSLPHRPPSVGSVLVDLSTNDYGVAYSTTYARKLRSTDLGEVLFHEVEVVMVDGSYLPQAVEAATTARKRRIPVVLDCGGWKDGLEELLPQVDYVIASKEFLMPGCSSSEDLFAAMREYGVYHVAVTRSAAPILAHENGTTREIPVPQIKVLDSLGAGDIFHGVFCHHILEQDFFASLQLAGEVATMSCTSLGPRTWIEQIKLI